MLGELYSRIKQVHSQVNVNVRHYEFQNNVEFFTFKRCFLAIRGGQDMEDKFNYKHN